jgi:hypothetical protein
MYTLQNFLILTSSSGSEDSESTWVLLELTKSGTEQNCLISSMLYSIAIFSLFSWDFMYLDSPVNFGSAESYVDRTLNALFGLTNLESQEISLASSEETITSKFASIIGLFPSKSCGSNLYLK